MRRKDIEAEVRRTLARLKHKEEWLAEELEKHAPEDHARIQAAIRLAWLEDVGEDLERIAIWLAEGDEP